MKVGVTLPQFGEDTDEAIGAAVEAERRGLDGVFVFDHLWAIGQPDRPAIGAFPLLGALAAATTSVHIGTLVARVGLFPDAVLVHHFATLGRMVGDRLIAGLGTGDRLSAAENLAFGVEYPPARERREALAECARRVRALGITTWVGGRAPATIEVAEREADAVNVWAAPPDEVASLAATRRVPVTWGGIVPGDPDQIARHIATLAAAGATWAVCAAPRGPARVVEAVRIVEALRIVAEDRGRGE